MKKGQFKMGRLGTLFVVSWLVFFNMGQAQAQFGGLLDLAADIAFREPKSSETITLLGQAKQKSFLPKETFEVLIWNVHKADDPNWFDDIQMLAQNSKLVMLQEAYFSSDFNQTLLQKNGTQWVNGVSFQMLHQMFTGTGVTTGSTVQSSKREYVRTFFTEPVVKTSKLTLLTYYPIKDNAHPLLAINIHAINFVPTFVFRSELKRLHQKIKEHKGPIILGGDFNTWTDGRKEALEKLARDNNLREVAFEDGARSTGLGKILDHAYIRNMDVVEVDNLSYINTSDHKPLRFKVRLK